jgi:hypothetical protein
MYLVGAGVFAIAIGGLLYSRCGNDEPTKDEPAPVAQATQSAAQPKPSLPEYAPPPPPEEEEDAGAGGGDGDDGKTAAAPKPGGKAPAGGGACANCGKGVASRALTSAVSKQMGLARGCYNRALRGGGGEGKIVVSVRVGSTGQLCGASISQNTTGNPGLASCVLSKFQGRTYPKPQKGCVVINAPINFSMKQ